MLWVGSDLDSGLVALLGICLLILSDTLSWKDIAANKNAVSCDRLYSAEMLNFTTAEHILTHSHICIHI